MRSFSLLVPMVFATFALAQSPQSFNYQGVARDAVGEPLSGQAIGVEFRLRSGSALGPVAYSETHGATTDMFGLFTLHVGEGTPGTGTFSAIDWRSGPYYLEIGLDLSASGIYISFGTQQLLSVPYALHAGSSGDLPPGTEVGQIMHWDGGAWVADSGLYVHDKRFGIGITTPECPLGIKGEPGQDDAMISFHSEDDSQKWNINLNPTGGDMHGFSIDDASSGLSQSRLFIADSTGHVGIGDTVPEAPLAIKSRNILKTYFETGDIPTQDNFGISTDSTGFDIGQGIPGSMTSRLFIDASTGNVGVGTTTPTEKYFIHAIHAGERTGLGLRNGAVAANAGWVIAHVDDAAPQRAGAFALLEKDGIADSERITVLPGGNVGINELMPFATLHVSRDPADPSSLAGLQENTGIVVVGPITENIAFDYKGIQARHLLAGSTSVQGTSGLHLQRLGGDLIIHGDDAVLSNQVTVSSDGKIGVGKTATEKLEINGAIVVGNTDNVAPSSGTIRWNSATDDLEGFTGTAWSSLTGGGWEKVDNTDDIVASGDHPKVGIGTAAPMAALHVSEVEATTGSSTAVVIESQATTSSTSAADTRIGLRISTLGEWSSNAGAKSASLMVTATPGGSSALHANAAAVLGGNVVIGDLTGDQMVGTGGSNVLAIQNGSPPADGLSGGPGSNGAIQFYSADLSGVSTIHVMNGNGDVIKLYKEAPITPAENLPVDGIYDPSEAIVIENMRTRITELENVLKALGLLTP
ncbi:MAG: hypothetical protein IPG69_03865 [Flavobacteriales bacterium]|nr:hypothetical protein [Flavobacteriales bacterium]